MEQRQQQQQTVVWVEVSGAELGSGLAGPEVSVAACLARLPCSPHRTSLPALCRMTSACQGVLLWAAEGRCG